MDCVFCQLGRTTNCTLRRAEYAPVWRIESELDAWIKGGGKADAIALSGSGEPTLHTRFGDILRFIRDRTDIPIALLSNGSLFCCPGVRAAAVQADVVKLSLSTWDQLSFNHVNRPCPDILFSQMLDGFRAFRDEFGGKLWIEVFVMAGVNDAREDVGKIAALVKTIGPDEIQLNTAVRPSAEKHVRAVPRAELDNLADLFCPAARVIVEYSSDKSSGTLANEDTILAMLKRRPCTAQQIGEVFGMHLNEVSKYLGKLSRTGRIRSQDSGREGYFVAVEAGGG